VPRIKNNYKIRRVLYNLQDGYNWWNGRESFSRHQQFFRQLRRSPHFMEPEYSFSCQEQTITCHCRQPHKSNPRQSILIKFNFNIILPSTPGFFMWVFASGIRFKTLWAFIFLLTQIYINRQISMLMPYTQYTGN
jgi:hypothetical protein